MLKSELNPMGIGFGSFKTHTVRCEKYRNPIYNDVSHRYCLAVWSGICCNKTGTNRTQQDHLLYDFENARPPNSMAVFVLRKGGYDEVLAWVVYRNICHISRI